jgi:hypothetical protein
LVNYISIPYTTLNFRISPNLTINSSGFMQEFSSAGSSASPNRSKQLDMEEMLQLWSSEHHEQIVREELQQAFAAIRESSFRAMVNEVLHRVRQQMLMPPPSYHQQQMLPPVPPHYDQLQIPCMQESSSAVSATSTGQSQQPDIEVIRQLWKRKYDHMLQEKVQQAVREIIESTVREVADEVLHQPMSMLPPSILLPAADAASLSTSLLSSTDAASVSTSLLPTAVPAASSVPASNTSIPSPVSVSTPVSTTTVLPARDD